MTLWSNNFKIKFTQEQEENVQRKRVFEEVSIRVAIREWRKENDKLFDVGLNMENVTGRERVFYEDQLTERVSAQGGGGWHIWRKQRKSKKEEDEKKERDDREVKLSIYI